MSINWSYGDQTSSNNYFYVFKLLIKYYISFNFNEKQTVQCEILYLEFSNVMKHCVNQFL